MSESVEWLVTLALPRNEITLRMYLCFWCFCWVEHLTHIKLLIGLDFLSHSPPLPSMSVRCPSTPPLHRALLLTPRCTRAHDSPICAKDDEMLTEDHNLNLDDQDVRETKKARASSQRPAKDSAAASTGRAGNSGSGLAAGGGAGGGQGTGLGRFVSATKQEALRSKGLFKIAPQSKVINCEGIFAVSQVTGADAVRDILGPFDVPRSYAPFSRVCVLIFFIAIKLRSTHRSIRSFIAIDCRAAAR